MERAVWYPKNHFTQKHYFTVCFTKLLTWQTVSRVCYELGNFITYLSIKSWTLKQSCEFDAEFRWEVAKLVPSVRCSWFNNITTQMNLNKVKKKILNQAMLILWCLVFKMYTKLFEKYRRTPHHRRMARLAFCLQ